MDTNEKTKNRLAISIKELMKKTPLDKITVKDIVAHSGMTRQTFYRNFKDKYDLVNWHFERLAQKSFKQMGVSFSLIEGLTKKFNFIKEEICFFTQAFNSQDYNSLVAYDYESIFAFYSEIIESKTKAPLEKDIEFLLQMYCKGSISMTVEWVRKNMPITPEEIAQLLVEALPPKLEKLLCDL